MRRNRDRVSQSAQFGYALSSSSRYRAGPVGDLCPVSIHQQSMAALSEAPSPRILHSSPTALSSRLGALSEPASDRYRFSARSASNQRSALAYTIASNMKRFCALCGRL